MAFVQKIICDFTHPMSLRHSVENVTGQDRLTKRERQTWISQIPCLSFPFQKKGKIELIYLARSHSLFKKRERGKTNTERITGNDLVNLSFAKEPYERDDILQKRPSMLRSLLAPTYMRMYTYTHTQHTRTRCEFILLPCHAISRDSRMHVYI